MYSILPNIQVSSCQPLFLHQQCSMFPFEVSHLASLPSSLSLLLTHSLIYGPFNLPPSLPPSLLPLFLYWVDNDFRIHVVRSVLLCFQPCPKKGHVSLGLLPESHDVVWALVCLVTVWLVMFGCVMVTVVRMTRVVLPLWWGASVLVVMVWDTWTERDGIAVCPGKCKEVYYNNNINSVIIA